MQLTLDLRAFVVERVPCRLREEWRPRHVADGAEARDRPALLWFHGTGAGVGGAPRQVQAGQSRNGGLSRAGGQVGAGRGLALASGLSVARGSGPAPGKDVLAGMGLCPGCQCSLN